MATLLSILTPQEADMPEGYATLPAQWRTPPVEFARYAEAAGYATASRES
jgi:hypothetical protein